MALLSRDQILGAQDLKEETVEVPEWGGSLRLREMTGAARDALENATVKQKGDKTELNTVGFRARLVAATVIDDNGDLMFTEKDIRALGEKSAAALDKVAAVASRISGMTEDDQKELVENFDNDQSDTSISV